ncbi:hypothetical protein BKA80DRAFT_260851 [Phyllosticta citrichinensis]
MGPRRSFSFDLAFKCQRHVSVRHHHTCLDCSLCIEEARLGISALTVPHFRASVFC